MMGLKDNWLETNWLIEGDPDIYEGYTEKQIFEAAVMATAYAVDGLSAETPSEYLEFIANKPSRYDRAMAHGMLGMSSCALSALGMWRCLGVEDEILWNKYRVGRAVADVVQIASSYNAWTSSMKIEKDSQPFEVGDVVIVRKPEHVFTIVGPPEVKEYREGPKMLVEKIVFPAQHGGRRTKSGKQLVEVTETVATWRSGHLVITGRSKATGIPSIPKNVVGIARTTNFAMTKSAELPPNWKDYLPRI